MDIHLAMQIISGVIAVCGIGLAWFMYCGRNFERAKAAAARFPVAVKVLQDKWYVDELYDAVIVKPLRLKSHVLFVIDQLIVDGLVLTVGWLPGNTLGRVAQRGQSGRLQGYGLGMVAGLALIAVLVFFMVS